MSPDIATIVRCIRCFLSSPPEMLHALEDVVWDIAPYSPYITQHFGGTYQLHFQGGKSVEQEPT
jgi:hypothetical protein